MLGYVLSHRNITNETLKDYEIKSFDVLSDDLEKNIYVIENNKILYDGSNLIQNATINKHIQVLKWLIKSKYIIKKIDSNICNYKKGSILCLRFNEYRDAFYSGSIKILKWVKKFDNNFKNSIKKFYIDFHIVRNNVKFLKYLDTNYYKNRYSNKPFYGLTHTKTLNFLIHKINIKKIIMWTVAWKSKKIIKFKLKNNYLKGYKKN
jgi:hypothetical protein